MPAWLLWPVPGKEHPGVLVLLLLVGSTHSYMPAGSRDDPCVSYKGWWQQEQGQGPHTGPCPAVLL